MNTLELHQAAHSTSVPIAIGLSCWLWERGRARQVANLGEKLGVTLQMTERVEGLRRVIRGQVAGPNVDRFISEFARLD